MAKSHEYTGILKTPRESVLPPLEDESYNPFDKECQAEVLARWTAQQRALIDALFQDCGVDQKDSAGWEKVALVLAGRHVKGFQEKGLRGRKRAAWAADETLMFDMQVLIKDGKTISNAARIVAKKRDYSEKQGAAIETHYHRTLKEWEHSHMLVERWARQTKSKRNSVAKSRG